MATLAAPLANDLSDPSDEMLERLSLAAAASPTQPPAPLHSVLATAHAAMMPELESVPLGQRHSSGRRFRFDLGM